MVILDLQSLEPDDVQQGCGASNFSIGCSFSVLCTGKGM